MPDAYHAFLERKRTFDPPSGIEGSVTLPDFLKPHQADIIRWALRRGRAAIFAGTGLGKTLMELLWAREVAQHTGKPVLILAPLAVAQQHGGEAGKFGLSATVVQARSDSAINISNYQKLDRFDLGEFGGVALDESSILKNVDGHYRSMLIEQCAAIPFRLAATATPAPNDFMELGNHAEFLGIMSYTDMLATFFVHDGGDTKKWRLKGHAEEEFWRWMASWAVMLRKPSDLGYGDDGYDLPALTYHHHRIAVDYRPSFETGTLFPMEARTLSERLAARRESVGDRVAKAASLVTDGFCDRVTECLGNLNTPNAVERNISPTPTSASVEKRKAATPKRTQNTCESTTGIIATSTKEPQSSKLKSTGDGENGTPQTLNSERNASETRATESLRLDVPLASKPFTASTPANTKPCSKSSQEDVASAEISRNDISSLITAMKAAGSGDCSALPAIPASVISKMTQSGLIEPWCIWCNLNSEQEAVAKALGPLAFSVHGAMPDKEKERAVFDWISGKRPVMISKPAIMGFGMNFQHCRNTVFVGLNDSFEQVYQAVRRFWRFGQTLPVNVHFIASEREGAVVANFRRKEADAERMAAAMVRHMADLSSAAVRGAVRDRPDYRPEKTMTIPNWIGVAA